MKKVLVVEDNDLNLKLFCDLLASRKYEVLVSKDGHNVMDMVFNSFPDIILMDIQLNSGISGLDIIKQLKHEELTCKIPIIAITAFAQKSDESLIRKSGCDAYMSKPTSIKHFFELIESFSS